MGNYETIPDFNKKALTASILTLVAILFVTLAILPISTYEDSDEDYTVEVELDLYGDGDVKLTDDYYEESESASVDADDFDDYPENPPKLIMVAWIAAAILSGLLAYEPKLSEFSGLKGKDKELIQGSLGAFVIGIIGLVWFLISIGDIDDDVDFEPGIGFWIIFAITIIGAFLIYGENVDFNQRVASGEYSPAKPKRTRMRESPQTEKVTVETLIKTTKDLTKLLIEAREGSEILIDRIADSIGLDKKTSEDLLLKVLKENPELGTYYKLEQKFIK